MDENIFGDREIIVIDLVQCAVIGNQTRGKQNSAGIIIDNLIIVQLDVRSCKNDYATSWRRITYAPGCSKTTRLGKIAFVVVVDIVVMRLHMPATL